MEARYYAAGSREEAYEMIDQGKTIRNYFSENLKAQFLFNEVVDSAYVLPKGPEGLPNNMPHYDI